MNGQVLAMRVEYAALIAVADGLFEVIRNGAACNLLTMARLAHEARDAARKIASEIERLIQRVPLFSRLAAAVVSVVKAVAGLMMP